MSFTLVLVQNLNIIHICLRFTDFVVSFKKMKKKQTKLNNNKNDSISGSNNFGLFVTFWIFAGHRLAPNRQYIDFIYFSIRISSIVPISIFTRIYPLTIVDTWDNAENNRINCKNKLKKNRLDVAII